jgi:predicted amino acid racemase
MDLFDSLARRNSDLVRAAAQLHQAGELAPDTYVADLDTIVANATLVRDAAVAAGIEVLYEAKQFGRAPAIVEALRTLGLTRAIAIDIEEVDALDRLGVTIGHAGHLGQIPARDIERVVTRIRPQFLTVYSLEKARAAAAAAASAGIEQALVLRVNGPDDLLPVALAGGTPERAALDLALTIDALDGARFGGLTTYPGIRFDLAEQRWVQTANLATLGRIGAQIADALGRPIEHLNPAGNCCTRTLPLLAAAGATHCEPGQAFVGGLVANGFVDEPEIPAIAYLTEVSHRVGETPYVFAASMVANATIGIWHHLEYDALAGVLSSDGRDPLGVPVRMSPQHFPASDPTGFMYNAVRPLRSADAHIGDTVIFGFRTQLYRANGARLAVVGGIREGTPRVVGVYDRNGRNA